ncbi:MAG TPA: PBP1A family penicillin-binding protein [Microthrixaceae bacterium]|nr:PBP1A family penicillin-binding protein [Microthrixaceae bacterium]
MIYVAMLLVIAAVGGGFVALNSVDLPEVDAPVETSFVCLAGTGDGGCGPDNSVAQFSSSENRVVLPYDEMPRILVQAVLAAEDRSYFGHSGIDPVGIARALYQDVKSDGSTQGGSTITQQYVKLVYLSSERTLVRKVKEAALAVKLERKYSKTEILERYLNEVYFGRGAYGIEAAARAYFDKPAMDVSLEEAALLAGLIRAPEKADPSRHAEEAERRRRTVLAAMVETGDITPVQAEAADNVPLEGTVLERAPKANNTVVRAEFAGAGGEYVTEWVRQQLTSMFGEGAAYTRGLRIYLTIDESQQRAAYESVANVLNQPGDPAAALVSITEGGQIQAMVGGNDYANNKVNYALGKAGGGSGRQPGSTFKTFALAAFVEAGNSVKSVYSAPKELILPKADEGKDWPVHNYDDHDLGTLTVEEATWRSANTAYAQIMQTVGPQKIAEAATKAGIGVDVPPNQSVVVGTTEVSVLDLATAYSTFANRGAKVAPFVIRRVEDPQGNVLFEQPEPAREQVFAPEVADTVTSVLRGVIDKGTGRPARMNKRASAGKTGTTDEYKDAWFAGYTCHRTAVVWVGYPQPQQMLDVRGVKVSGATFPAQIWNGYMAKATEADDSCTWEARDVGTNKVNPELVAGPPTTTTVVPPPTAPTVPGAATPTTAPVTTAASPPPPTTTAVAPPPAAQAAGAAPTATP